MSGARLRLEGIAKDFGGRRGAALRGIDLEVPGGSILVLLGSSGAGKTTLLRIIAGLEEADAGRVVLDERVLSDPRVLVQPERRGVGLVFQHLELWPHMTVAENIAFGLPGRPRGRRASSNDAVRDLAEHVGVSALLDRSPATLSGGERQRVAIARTLAPSPDVILYDEPLANLDPERRVDLRRLIHRLCRERGATLVYVTHDAEEAMEMGDQIAVLAAGHVAETGDPATLYRTPRTLAGARALGPLNVVWGTLDGDAVLTPLGRLPLARGGDRRDSTVAAERDTAAALAVFRPEAVALDGDLAAEVLDARPRGAGWSFTARLDPADVHLEGYSDRALERGDRVGLRVRGPVVVVTSDEKEEVLS